MRGEGRKLRYPRSTFALGPSPQGITGTEENSEPAGWGFHGPHPVILSGATASRMRSSLVVEGSLPFAMPQPQWGFRRAGSLLPELGTQKPPKLQRRAWRTNNFFSQPLRDIDHGIAPRVCVTITPNVRKFPDNAIVGLF